MYIPQVFREDDLDVLHDVMRQYSFATLITQHESRPVASHVPFVLQAGEGPYGTLLGHLARANPQWRDFGPEQEALVIFQGPHAYISPSWYEVHPSVPTWNYAAVHAYGVPRAVDDHDELHDLLRVLVQTYEAPLPQPWAFDLPEDYLHRMMQGIVGVTMRIIRLEGKVKLSQNRPLRDQQRVAEALRKQGDAMSAEVATLMSQRFTTTR